jgi:hypothetical protein
LVIRQSLIAMKRTSLPGVSIPNQVDASLHKKVSKMIRRVERILVPPNSVKVNPYSEEFDSLLNKLQTGQFYTNVFESPTKSKYRYSSKNNQPLLRNVDWDKLELEVIKIIGKGDEDYILPIKIQEEFLTEKKIQDDEEQKKLKKERLNRLQVTLSYII